jgi:bacterioferritin
VRENDQVINALNEILTNELTAVNQYFIHAHVCENWATGASGTRCASRSAR